MRLNRIKLAGFKSFVDPTTIPFPARLCGIVGPNGCGKSNVIDAVMWVMGESSAKHLRGDCMADVIFNGSNTRQPVGLASVELMFDNADGALGGPWAAYSEIAIKRQVDREGLSVYSLNGNRCRRRDITDLFLGTGVGAKSYAVIEQGMISRIIEAKPEEIRFFIEEAAGVSKYKERRKETENRICNTQTNLSRIRDIRGELEKQLDHLQRQARAAERYRVLEQEQRRLEGALIALEWLSYRARQHEQATQLRQRETALEQALARLRSVESGIERSREHWHTSSQQLQAIEKRFYTATAEIERLEQSVQHLKERNAAMERELRQIELDLTSVRSHMAQAKEEVGRLAEDLRSAQPKTVLAEQAELNAQSVLNAAERALADWQPAWNAYNTRASEASRNEDVEKTRREHLVKAVTEIEERIRRLGEEQAATSYPLLEQEIAIHREELAGVELECHALAQNRAGARHDVAILREGLHGHTDALNAVRAQTQIARGRLASLEALQQSALGKDQAEMLAWLQENGLANAARLVERVTVEPGWERALECVLKEHLDAVCVGDLDELAQRLESFPQGSLGAVEIGQAAALPLSGARIDGFPLLSDKTQLPSNLGSLLEGVYLAESLSEALTVRKRLPAQASVVTKAGERLGAGWVKIDRPQGEEAMGMLRREREIRALSMELERWAEQDAALSKELQDKRHALSALEESDAQLQEELEAKQNTAATLRSTLASLEEREQNQRRRARVVNEDLHVLRERERACTQEIKRAESALEQLRSQVADLLPERERLEEARRTLMETLTASRHAWQQAREHSHSLALTMETLRSRLSVQEEASRRSREREQQLIQRHGTCLETLAASQAPAQRTVAELEQRLKEHMTVEHELNAARQALQGAQDAMRAQEAMKGGVEKEVEEMRSQLEQARLALQALEVRAEDVKRQLQRDGFEPEELLGTLQESETEGFLRDQLESTVRKLERLGPINLAAIEECKQIAERKSYIDQQHDDLDQALETLTQAIKKIDRETRARFKETFDRVNQGLETMFPRLFGGGRAYLELTDEDLLNAGVTLMARPPGKRNSTIHLLSGGEKALTALALVFALFELNPAPFCILDEADAPLDDTNVERYCVMLRSMAEKTQFVFVTHNKITMEIADQLLGVTMQEPGVSRVVSVDMEQAVQMAASA
ncbi:MAG: chromosome segregation protein SMC [Gammaproteobacteria bacterium]